MTQTRLPCICGRRFPPGEKCPEHGQGYPPETTSKAQEIIGKGWFELKAIKHGVYLYWRWWEGGKKRSRCLGRTYFFAYNG